MYTHMGSDSSPKTDSILKHLIAPNEREFVSQFLEESIGCAQDDCPDDLANFIFHVLSRQEEVENAERDSLGRWQASLSKDGGQESASFPNIDEKLARLGDELARRYPDRKRKTRWPEGRPFALCLSHDVDYVSTRGHVGKFFRRFGRIFTGGGSRAMSAKLTLGSVYRLATTIGRPDGYSNFNRWLEFEDNFGFRSTFYFCPSEITKAHVFDTDYKYSDQVVFAGTKITVAEMIRQIKSRGWDIGLHGSYYSATDPALLREQKKELESVLGTPVLSCRQHYLQYDIKQTPKLQSDAGFLADSTQGFTVSNGFRAQTSLPYPCWDVKAGVTLPILEIPLHVMDTALFYGSDAPANEEEAVQQVLTIMDKVERVHGCLTLNWHPHNIARPALWNTYCRVLEEAHRRGAWGCSVEQLLHWWEQE